MSLRAEDAVHIVHKLNSYSKKMRCTFQLSAVRHYISSLCTQPVLTYHLALCLLSCAHSPLSQTHTCSVPRSRRSTGRPGPQLAGIGPPRADSSPARSELIVQYARQRRVVAAPSDSGSYSHVRRSGPLASLRAGRPPPRSGEWTAHRKPARPKVSVVRER